MLYVICNLFENFLHYYYFDSNNNNNNNKVYTPLSEKCSQSRVFISQCHIIHIVQYYAYWLVWFI